jgi:hypothetical protein
MQQLTTTAQIRIGDQVTRRDALGEWIVVGFGDLYYSLPHRDWRRDALLQSAVNPLLRQWSDVRNCRPQ